MVTSSWRVLKLIAACIGACAALSLAGCSAPSQLPVFSEKQSDADHFPEGGTPNVIAGLDGSSSRLLSNDSGIRIYAALSAAPHDGGRAQCLVLFEGTQGFTACGGDLPVQIKVLGKPAYLLSAAQPDDSENWSKVGDYLYVGN
jgi:hypothetical protein